MLSLLFLLIGVESTSYLAFDNWGLAFLIFVASLLVRFLIITGATQSFPVWRDKISWRESLLLSWSGLKGSMSVFLILNLHSKEAQGTELILSLAFSAVLLSLVVQSVGIHPLSKKLLNRGENNTIR
ncbi:cation:proton antiporter domain-containing protein [Halobacillus amylolyticus]|uniref:cation:proton antiporter domain-containing protein n=1 Tax=Halobacillus amylolyticus TaxID=2932259 RepID=UPI0029625BDA|nr:cation:proton antiporter [Halobacillus amylolyticus]